MRFPSEVEESDAIVDIGVLRIVQDLYPPKATGPLLSPGGRHTVVHLGGDTAVEVIDV
ncbi:hypothetical protein [Sphingomonas sp. AP4-R1]|uniref:hypothetical protein n=1 Tax=Sphingomonas sp. AP4-R1 TaxID=2735134 RepID=UPI0020A3686F|nr:hypothetical protein [Sphingomonas sp. AP4-R1]